MTSHIRQVAKLTISLVLPGLLSGCFAAQDVFAVASLPQTAGEQILCTTEESIGVKYRTAEPNDQHDETMQLISEHCVDWYVETKRTEYAY